MTCPPPWPSLLAQRKAIDLNLLDFPNVIASLVKHSRQVGARVIYVFPDAESLLKYVLELPGQGTSDKIGTPPDVIASVPRLPDVDERSFDIVVLIGVEPSEQSRVLGGFLCNARNVIWFGKATYDV